MSLSKRGQARFDEVNASPSSSEVKWYDRERNPGGPINLSTAENLLLSPELLEYIHKHFHITESHLRYRSALLRGLEPSLIDVFPKFLNRTLNPRFPITSDQVVLGPGVGQILTHLIWHLCDEGDEVLLAAPFYGNYVGDLAYPACAATVPVHFPLEVDPFSTESLRYIRKAIESKRDEGVKIKALLLNNPHNPLARCYPKGTIIGYAMLALEFDTHLIVDELFANQVFSLDDDVDPFVSILSLDLPPGAAERITVLASPTKDFGASGFRVGGLVAQKNRNLLRVLSEGLRPTLSSTADAVFTAVLKDDAYVEWFLEENKTRLRAAYALVTGWCRFQGIPYLEAHAGQYFVIDLAPVLHLHGPTEGSVEEKMKATIRAIQEGGVELSTSGKSGHPVPTRCRWVFTQRPEVMKIALERLECVFNFPHWVGE